MEKMRKVWMLAYNVFMFQLALPTALGIIELGVIWRANAWSVTVTIPAWVLVLVLAGGIPYSLMYFRRAQWCYENAHSDKELPYPTIFGSIKAKPATGAGA